MRSASFRTGPNTNPEPGPESRHREDRADGEVRNLHGNG